MSVVSLVEKDSKSNAKNVAIPMRIPLLIATIVVLPI